MHEKCLTKTFNISSIFFFYNTLTLFEYKGFARFYAIKSDSKRHLEAINVRDKTT